MRFYVNEVYLPEHDLRNRYIGLFTNNNWSGEGNFCGWYTREYYNDTTLLAYGVQLNRSVCSHEPEDLFNGGFVPVNQYFDKIAIGSCYWEKVITVDTVEEAIEIFINQSW